MAKYVWWFLFKAELQKGESVCIDRCVAKYLEVHERIGKKLTEISMRDQVTMARFNKEFCLILCKNVIVVQLIWDLIG